MRCWAVALAAAVAALPSAAAARPCDDGRLGFLANALLADRLIQAERMIAAMQRDCAQNRRFTGLSAHYSLRAGRTADAYRLYLGLAGQEPANSEYAAGVGLSAMRLGHDDQAYEMLRRATEAGIADWRAWNGMAILHDRRREWEASAQTYERAAQLAPYEASIWSNRGYSLILQRRAAEALPFLDRAVSLDAENRTIRRTRELALALAGTYDENRRQNESNADWAQRLNNIGYGAWLAGDAATARRLLTRAIEVSETRFERAEQNLARVEGSE